MTSSVITSRMTVNFAPARKKVMFEWTARPIATAQTAKLFGLFGPAGKAMPASES
jgi:hypothetical protein